MNSQVPLQRIPMDKNLFWNGTITLNEGGGHSFFDVRTRKGTHNNASNTGLYTNDIPPFPLTNTDSINVQFILENCSNTTPQRNVLGTSTITGPDLIKALESQPEGVKNVTVQLEGCEWQFIALEKVWVLRSVMLYVPTAHLKQLIKDL